MSSSSYMGYNGLQSATMSRCVDAIFSFVFMHYGFVSGTAAFDSAANMRRRVDMAQILFIGGCRKEMEEYR